MTLRLVLDTNVWLDWLVFDDASVAPIKAAVATGRAEILIDAACELELLRVLGYPLRKHVLDADACAALIAECRRVARMLDSVRAPAGALPVCRDEDDQKFLELALRGHADFLVTKDLMLLELAWRNVKRTPFRIVTPAEIHAAFAARTTLNP